ncbi:MAG: NADPH-dependent F420 reductase [Cyanobacteria bacterium J06627_28]
MNIAFLGIGNVGSALADNLAKQGHTVMIAARNPDSNTVKAAQAKNSNFLVKSVSEAIDTAEVIFLATPFSANESALKSAGALSGKILVDCTNPVGPGLSHGLKSTRSGAESVQAIVQTAKVVKAFTIYGFENFENTHYPGYTVNGEPLKPAMLIASDDATAKSVVGQLCEELGWETIDTGPLSMSLHLEHMTLLWIKMARVQGMEAGFTWAMLRR